MREMKEMRIGNGTDEKRPTKQTLTGAIEDLHIAVDELNRIKNNSNTMIAEFSKIEQESIIGDDILAYGKPSEIGIIDLIENLTTQIKDTSYVLDGNIDTMRNWIV